MKSILKSISVVAVVVVSLILLILVKAGSHSGRRIHRMIFIEETDDWLKCELDGCDLDEGRNSVIFGKDRNGSLLVTFRIEPGFPFHELILSWNAEQIHPNSALNFEVSVSPDGSEWYRFQYLIYGDIDSTKYTEYISLPSEIAGIGRVATDILKLKKPMKFARVFVKGIVPDESSEIILRRLSLCFASDNPSWRNYGKFGGESGSRDVGQVKLAVPYLTQRGLPGGLSGCCSPASVAMVLNYHDSNVDLEPFCREVYDPNHDIFGNWPYNVQAAYLKGMAKTWVEIHSGFDEIYEEVSIGKPVIISIAYGYDELPNSPIHEALEGHLVAVVGFGGVDTVICNDPAGHNIDDGLIRYPRKELESSWIGHGGIAYHIWP